MANINVLGDFNKSGLTMEDIQDTVKAAFGILSPPLSSRAQVEGSLKNNTQGKGFLHSPLSGVGRNDKTINIAFVDPDEIQVKNLEYRKKDSPTDVLSFDYGDEGDILLCTDIIDNLRDKDETLSEAILKTLIHGTLHLFGFDHENEKERDIMEETGEKIFIQLSFPRRRESI